MKAWIGGVGQDWEMQEVVVPEPGPRQLLIRVRAAGLNRADLFMLKGTYDAGSADLNNFTAGLELAGEVEAIGQGVTGFEVGNRVMGTTVGAFAEFALVDYRHVVPVPKALGWTDAAALPVGLTTEHDALVTQGGFSSGQSVLIVGATSGVGMIGVQLARALGAFMVIATTTSGAKIEALRAVGADLVINTSVESVIKHVDTATNGDGVDIVLDHVGGALFGDLLMTTRVRGTIVNIGRLSGARATIDLDQLSFRRLRVQGTTFSIRTAEERGEVAAALVPVVLPAVADGRIRPVVDRVVPFEQAQLAADRMRGGDTIGKVVIDVSAGAKPK